MDNFEKNQEFMRNMGLAIESERREPKIHRQMLDGLREYSGPRDTGLILGDASKIQSKYLLDNAGFKKIVDVDAHPMLLDEEIIPVADKRLERVLSTFEHYRPVEEAFDFIYGKSIAFTRKPKTPAVLERIAKALRPDGLFVGVWAAEKDTFRSQKYSIDELENLYAMSGFDITHAQEYGPRPTKGLVVPGVSNTFEIIAKRK